MNEGNIDKIFEKADRHLRASKVLEEAELWELALMHSILAVEERIKAALLSVYQSPALEDPMKNNAGSEELKRIIKGINSNHPFKLCMFFYVTEMIRLIVEEKKKIEKEAHVIIAKHPQRVDGDISPIGKELMDYVHGMAPQEIEKIARKKAKQWQKIKNDCNYIDSRKRNLEIIEARNHYDVFNDKIQPISDEVVQLAKLLRASSPLLVSFLQGAVQYGQRNGISAPCENLLKNEGKKGRSKPSS